jgi:hypothetical protein
VVIDDFNVIGSILLPYKANAKLIVYADAVLPFPASSQRLQHVSRRLPEIIQTGSRIHAVEFPPSYSFNAAPSPVCAHLSQFRRVVVFETSYHMWMVCCGTFNVKKSFLANRARGRHQPKQSLYRKIMFHRLCREDYVVARK